MICSRVGSVGLSALASPRSRRESIVLFTSATAHRCLFLVHTIDAGSLKRSLVQFVHRLVITQVLGRIEFFTAQAVWSDPLHTITSTRPTSLLKFATMNGSIPGGDANIPYAFDPNSNRSLAEPSAEDALQSPKAPDRLIVGVDFGTTYSGTGTGLLYTESLS